MQKILELTYQEIIDKLNKHEISSSDLIIAVLDQIDLYDPTLEAFISVAEREQLIESAKKSDERWQKNKPLSLIDGIPIALKDNIHVDGFNTTCASRILENYRPPFEATVTRRIKENGGIIIGKTNLDEFAMGSTTENSAFKKTRNPWDITRVPGGSSGGSAVSVATRMSLLALGSDTGGSIRQPASFCGIVGLKPTYGLVSRYGLAAYASSLDQIGPLSRSIYDSAVLLNIISCFEPKDSTSLAVEQQDYTRKIGHPIKGFKIAVFPDLLSKGIAPGVKSVYEKTLITLKELGAIIEETEFPALDHLISTYYFIATAEASSNLSRYDGVKYGYRSPRQTTYDDMLVATRSAGFGKEVKKRILLGNFVLSSGYYDEYYCKSLKVRRYIMEAFKKLLGNYDAIVLPTAPDTAFKFGESLNDPLKIYLADITTVTANLTGLPALSIPGGFSENLPVGIQLIGAPLSEALLFQIGYQLENALNLTLSPDFTKIKAENNKHTINNTQFNNFENQTILYTPEKIKAISNTYNNRKKLSSNRVYCSDLVKQIGKEVVIAGWIHKINSLGGIIFYTLRDISGMTQLVIEGISNLPKIIPEMVVEIQGIVSQEERSPYQNIEIKVKEIRILGEAESDLPIAVSGNPDNITLPTLLDYRPISLRIPNIRKIFMIQTEILRLFSEFLRKNRFAEIKSPKIIYSGTEGGSNIFEIKYFEKTAYLAQSPQFYKQIMVGSGLERVFEVGPVFRAEIHNTVRHLNEYISMDFEMGFIRDEQDIIDMQESLIKYMINELQRQHPEILEEFKSDIKLPVHIPRIHFLEALKIAESAGVKDMDGDISPEGERVVCNYIEKEYDSSFVYIVGYPVKKRPLYTMPDDRIPGYTRSFDLLFKGIEITTGGMRIHDYQMLKKNIIAFGGNPNDFKDYLMTFKYGMPPHGGLGMGLERITMKILNLKNVREASLFPRDRNRIAP